MAQLCLLPAKHTGRLSWRAVQPIGQVAGTGNIRAQLKDGVPTGESVQPGSEDNDSSSQSRISPCSLWCHMCFRNTGAGLVLSVLNWQTVNNRHAKTRT